MFRGDHELALALAYIERVTSRVRTISAPACGRRGANVPHLHAAVTSQFISRSTQGSERASSAQVLRGRTFFSSQSRAHVVCAPRLLDQPTVHRQSTANEIQLVQYSQTSKKQEHYNTTRGYTRNERTSGDADAETCTVVRGAQRKARTVHDHETTGFFGVVLRAGLGHHRGYVWVACRPDTGRGTRNYGTGARQAFSTVQCRLGDENAATREVAGERGMERGLRS